MVISLESQNVKRKRVTGPNINFGFITNISFDISHIPFIIGLVIFSLLFSSGSIIFWPDRPVSMDLSSVKLPTHNADLVSRYAIDNYTYNKIKSYYTMNKLYPGDTPSLLAIKYDISRETLMNVNRVHSITEFELLNKIKIPVTDGFLHIVNSKDTLESLSLFYGVSKESIFRINGLSSESLLGLEEIFIPGIKVDGDLWRTDLYKYFIYPMDGLISKRFGNHTNTITGLTTYYEGIDISPGESEHVYASRGGQVSRIGYNSNYGNYIYLDHSGGFRTLYAHLADIDVSVFDRVGQGDVIASVGDSGYTSQKKLFFSLFKRDESIDPEGYLK